MEISRNNKNDIIKLLELGLQKIDLVKSVSFQVDDTFMSQLDLFRYLLQSPDWPTAVDPSLIVQNEEDKFVRAEAILDVIVTCALEGKKFLDYGCGEGHVVKSAVSRSPKVAMGYDIEEQNWNASINLTTNWGNIKAHAPYDVVLMYDVIDHLIREEPGQVLVKIREIIANDGLLFIRCHPWCGRHGTHLYKTINKAFLHLLLSDEELKELGYVGIPTMKILHPTSTYPKWFAAAGFREVDREITFKAVEDFFLQFKSKLWQYWEGSKDPEMDHYPGWALPYYPMRQEFNDYCLMKA